MKIQFEKVCKNYGGLAAIENVSFQIKEGEFVFIIGRNGAGKSTILKLLSRQEKASSGVIIVDDYDFRAINRRKDVMYRRRIGIMDKNLGCIAERTVYENVELAVRVSGKSVKKYRRHILNTLSRVGVESKADCYPLELSEGERARVLLARAIVMDPWLLILDEPTANLDPDNAWDMMLLLRELNHQGMTIVAASHATGLVTMMKQRVITLVKGVIVADEKRSVYNLKALDIYEERKVLDLKKHHLKNS